jgi:hypothetical protein
MGISATNALVSIQEGVGAVTNVASGATFQASQGAVETIALQSSTGVARWELEFIAPNYPPLDHKMLAWTGSGPASFQVQLPADQVGASNPINGIMFVSTVSDGVANSAYVIGFIQTTNALAVPVRHTVTMIAGAALQAYTNVSGVLTENANGAMSAIDGVTVAVGQTFFLPPGIAAAAADVGIYQIQSIGGASAKWTATLTSDWPLGGIVTGGTEIYAQQGTLYQGTTWVVTNTAPATIGTTTFTVFPRQMTQSITLVAGTATITNCPIVSATKVSASIVRTTANTSTATTGGYHFVGAITPGALGTVSAVLDATVAAGTINNADISTLGVTINNPV